MYLETCLRVLLRFSCKLSKLQKPSSKVDCNLSNCLLQLESNGLLPHSHLQLWKQVIELFRETATPSKVKRVFTHRQKVIFDWLCFSLASILGCEGILFLFFYQYGIETLGKLWGKTTNIASFYSITIN